MIVSAHQPGFLPWLGYFDKLAHCDRFVILDHVQFETENFQNRNRFKLANGAGWVTVPVERRGHEEAICDKRISYNDPRWQRRIWQTIEQSYGKAPYFRRYAPALEEKLFLHWERLADLTIDLLRLCLGWLEIDTPLVLSSTLAPTGKKSEMLANLCETLGADGFLSGMGGSRDYIDQALFAARGLSVTWQRFQHPEYPQRYDTLGFIPRLSVMDLLFNCGPKSRHILLGGAPAREVVAC